VVHLSTHSATDDVRVSVPARPDYVHVLRTVTGAVAARLALSLDDVDDLRLAVDEACARLLTLEGDPRTFRLDLRPLPGRLEVIVAVEATTTWPPTGFEDTLSWRILGALAETVRFELWNGAPAIRIVKRMLGNGG
jgi:serine/threonine-protein kinase RsbW